MGIKTLWSVLDCCGEKLDLRELRGQTLAVDLAGWVVQDNQCRALGGGRVAKPHLRNIFFRASALVGLGIVPVFVLVRDVHKLCAVGLIDVRLSTRTGPRRS
jgi:flap endonuclease GEN